MSGTDRTKGAVALEPAPVIILIDPQLGENIGMVARAMLNCGLTRLRLVRPRDGWPNATAEAAASGAAEVIEAVQLFDSTAAAVADLQQLYATTARPRGMVKQVVEPRLAARQIEGAIAGGEKVGILFGPERSGLVNDDVALADRVIEVPLNPAFRSLNLAQAVLLVGYEWFVLRASQDRTEPQRLDRGEAPLADKAEMINFFQRLEGALDDAGFLFPPEKRPGMVRNLRSLFGRLALTQPEVNTLHGIISALRDYEPPGEAPSAEVDRVFEK
ncbi:MAG: RNA methyltransferase [Pseudomonadota bacterium]